MGEFSRHNIQPLTVWTPDKGLFTDRHEIDIPPQGASSTNNVVFDRGYLRARGGFELYSDRSGVDTVITNSATIHISQYTPLIGTPDVLRVEEKSGDLYFFREDVGSDWIDIGSLPGGLLEGVALRSVNFKGRWYMASGSKPLQVYNGVDNVYDIDDDAPSADLAAPDSPRLVAANDARLFIADVKDAIGDRIPYRIAWSDTLNAGVWNGGYGAGTSGFVDLAGESDGITALYATSDIVIVFKARTIYVGTFVGPPQFYAFRRLVRGPGCISDSTLKEYRDGLLVWLGDDNVYMGLPGQRPQPIGNAIENRIREVVKLSDITKARAAIDRDNHLYRLFFPVNGGDDDGKVYKIFTCNLLNGSWWEGYVQNSDIDVTDAYTFRSANWTESVLISSVDGNIYRMSLDIDDDAGEVFPTEFVTGLHNWERMTSGKSQQANVQMIRVLGRQPVEGVGSSTVTLSLIHGNSLDRFEETEFGEQVIDGEAALYTEEREVSENFKIKIVSQSNTHPFIAGLSAGVIPEGLTHRYR